jgi:hypothetical protein
LLRLAREIFPGNEVCVSGFEADYE